MGRHRSAAFAELARQIGADNLSQAIYAVELPVIAVADAVIERELRVLTECLPDPHLQVQHPGVIAAAAGEVDFIDGNVRIVLKSRPGFRVPASGAGLCLFLGREPRGGDKQHKTDRETAASVGCWGQEQAQRKPDDAA